MRETVSAERARPGAGLRFLYGTAPGQALLRRLVKPGFSKLVGAALSTAPSGRLIKPFVRRNRIDLSRYDTRDVSSFNDFFCRELRGRPELAEGLIAPCDGKLTVYRIGRHSVLRVKDADYTLSGILMNSRLAREFEGGVCLIFRLTVDDYHRYCYFDDCRETDHWSVPGEFHTVQPIALKSYNVYHRNSREVTVMMTERFGKAVQVEVGAMCVGRIENSHGDGVHRKGEEKGRFMFGGSTIILLLKDARVDEEIWENTRRGLETVVKFGESIQA